MRRLRRLYEEKEKMPGIGRYPMGPTINISRSLRLSLINIQKDDSLANSKSDPASSTMMEAAWKVTGGGEVKRNQSCPLSTKHFLLKLPEKDKIGVQVTFPAFQSSLPPPAP